MLNLDFHCQILHPLLLALETLCGLSWLESPEPEHMHIPLAPSMLFGLFTNSGRVSSRETVVEEGLCPRLGLPQPTSTFIIPPYLCTHSGLIFYGIGVVVEMEKSLRHIYHQVQFQACCLIEGNLLVLSKPAETEMKALKVPQRK